MDGELRDRPVFICGHPKSGTSLLRSLFDSHPQVVTYPEETNFFRRYLPLALGKTVDQKLDLADRMLTHIFEWNLAAPPSHQEGFLDRDYSHVPAAEVRRIMRETTRAAYRHDGDVLASAVLAYGAVVGQLTPQSLCWVEKTPYNEHYTAQIFAWWPEARCIHVVRDPRDNFASYQRKHAEWSAESFGLNWARSTRAGIKNQEDYGRRRYWLVRYEDLVHSPGETLGALCEFLGIADDESLRRPARGGVPWQGNSMFAEAFHEISHAPVGRWVGQLDADEVFAIESLAASPMRAMGYAPAAPATGLTPATRRRVLKRLASLTFRDPTLDGAERVAIDAASHFGRTPDGAPGTAAPRWRSLGALLILYLKTLTLPDAQ